MKNFILLLGLLIGASNAFCGGGDGDAPRPKKCPDVNSIISAGLNHVHKHLYNENIWVVSQTNNTYNSEVTWSFNIWDIQAKDGPEALKNATTAIANLHFVGGPYPPNHKPIDRWYCEYESNEGYHAVASTPADVCFPLK